MFAFGCGTRAHRQHHAGAGFFDLKSNIQVICEHAALAGNPNPIRGRGQKKQGFVARA
jgi:hypothetical protein